MQTHFSRLVQRPRVCRAVLQYQGLLAATSRGVSPIASFCSSAFRPRDSDQVIDHIVRPRVTSSNFSSRFFSHSQRGTSCGSRTQSRHGVAPFLNLRPYSKHQSLISPDLILSSPSPDIDLPSDLSFHDFLFEEVKAYGNIIAVKDHLTGQTYRYNELQPTAEKIASGLHRAGLRQGDVLLCVSTNQPDLVPLMLACSRLGVLYSSANPAFTSGELARQMHDCGALVVVTIPQLSKTVDEAIQSKDFPNKIQSKYVFGESTGYLPFSQLKEDIGSDLPQCSINAREDVFLLPYSSGTTGFPKGVMLTHYNIVSNCTVANNAETVDIGEKVLGLLPMYHIFGQVVIQYCTLLGGGQLITLPLYEPNMFLKCMEQEKISVAHLVPPLINFMVKDERVMNYDLTSLRQIICSAAPLSKKMSEEFLSRISHGVTFSQGFGLTELSPVACYDAGAKRLGSVGTLTANTKGKFVDVESGVTVGPNQSGEFFVKGPQVMKGYWNNEAATKETITPDGWLATGDIGYYTEDGTIYIEDRRKELIKYKGSQVAPAELEALLLTHPNIRDAAVIGIPDDAAGELPRAFVVKKDAADQVAEQDVIDFVAEKVSSPKRLRGGVQFVAEIPRNPSGKVLRRVIKEQYLESTE